MISEVFHKIRSRLTLKYHQHFSHRYPELSTSPIAALTQLLAVPADKIEYILKTESLCHLMDDLKKHQSPVKMGGASYLELCYVIVNLTRPNIVVETGVSQGYSSAVLLQALVDSGQGKLYSIDLPAFQRGTKYYTGRAIPERLRSFARWNLLLGPDRQILPDLLTKIAPIDFFHYDSDKSYQGMLSTLELVWKHLRAGAILMMDDVNSNDAFLEFSQSVQQQPFIIPKPTKKDVYQWTKVYYVGLLQKPFQVVYHP
ncbi:class I SAM-dependent methyltransferase [candidate division CSSED10-310 bacterium]|uniref:Class I SAM-dependent methyltransferase n=1 Tax=candidate division CSSED10-310 bacterium TaxID=2855610 RepID=A0ABV6Z6C0_UNCC1